VYGKDYIREYKVIVHVITLPGSNLFSCVYIWAHWRTWRDSDYTAMIVTF